MLWSALRTLALVVGAVAVDSCGSDAERGPRRAPDFDVIPYRDGGVLGDETAPLSAILETQKRPVVLNFWAAQCPPCRTELAAFQEVWEEHRGRLLVLGIDMGAFTNLGTAEEARRLLADVGVTYPTGTPGGQSVVHDYRLLGLPATFFLEPGGEIFRVWTGGLDRAKLTALVGDLLAETGS